MKYNTEHEQLVLADYGRMVQNMVRHAQSLPDRSKRNQCAHTIIKVMATLTGMSLHKADTQQKLWDHLAEIAGYELDIDYPVAITPKEERSMRPTPLPYPMKGIQTRHYGNNVETALRKIAEMPEGAARNRMVGLVANQMKRLLNTQTRDSRTDDRVMADIARYTDGRVTLPSSFRFANTNTKCSQGTNALVGTKRKKKK